ncbi:MAG: hypothetical protein ACRDNL_24135, partial [Spirillospora sp.]
TGVAANRRLTLVRPDGPGTETTATTTLHDGTGALTGWLPDRTDRLLIVRPDCYVGADLPLPGTALETAAIVEQTLDGVLHPKVSTPFSPRQTPV